MQSTAHLAATVAWGGFAIAFVVGVVANKTNFCTMGAVSDLVNMGDWNRMRMWLLAIGVAVLGANALHLAGAVDLSKSIYPTPNFIWLSYLLGGLMFGAGMVLASGCGTKTLIRVGNGNLKSVIVFLVLGISAYVTMKGLFGVWRVTYLEPLRVTLSTGQDLPSMLAKALGADKRTLQIALTLLIGGGLVVFALAKKEAWTLDNLLGGIVIGAAIIAGWYLTGHIGWAENPETLETRAFGTNTGNPESITNVAPFAYTLELFMLWSDTSLKFTFAVAVVFGLIAGSAAHSLLTRQFRWEGFRTTEDMANHMVGAAMMGVGGVLAMGCTFGQGITGFSTLALGSIVTFAAIVAGATGMMKYQYWKMMREEG